MYIKLHLLVLVGGGQSGGKKKNTAAAERQAEILPSRAHSLNLQPMLLPLSHFLIDLLDFGFVVIASSSSTRLQSPIAKSERGPLRREGV